MACDHSWRLLDGSCADEVWARVSRTCGHATFFETPTWADVLAECFPRWRPAPVVAELGDGNCVVFPCMARIALGGMVRYREAMVPGVYGGPLFMRQPKEEDWRRTWQVVDALTDIVLCCNPFISPVGVPESAAKRDLVTHVLDLSIGMDSTWKGYRKGHRADVRASERSGIEVTLATAKQDVLGYYEVYRDALARWGHAASGFYPQRLFAALARNRLYGSAIRLWVARLDGSVVGGALVFYHNDHCVYWHGAVLRSHMACHPAHLLVHRAIEHAASSGYRWFDFNPSGGLDGVERFKTGFGARPVASSVYRRLGYRGRAFRVWRAISQQWLRKCPL